MYIYSDKEVKELLKTIVILVDTREQKNEHITNFLEKSKISYINHKLHFGDYSFMLPKNPESGIIRDTYYTNDICIERKNSLEELSNNLSNERDRFENEFLRACKKNCKVTMLIEKGSFPDIFEGRYNTEMNKNSYSASLFTFMSRYNVNVQFVEKKYSGQWIYCLFHYYLRELLI